VKNEHVVIIIVIILKEKKRKEKGLTVFRFLLPKINCSKFHFEQGYNVYFRIKLANIQKKMI